MVRDGMLHDAYLAKLEDVMNRVPAQAVKDQADAIFNEISSAAANDMTKMYPTDSFVWSLSYIKDWTDKRYASIRDQIAAQRAPRGPDRHADGSDGHADGPGGHAGGRRYAVTRLAIVAAGAAALALSAAACGGGDDPAEVDNACGFRDGEPNNNAERATTVDMGAMYTGCLESRGHRLPEHPVARRRHRRVRPGDDRRGVRHGARDDLRRHGKDRAGIVRGRRGRRAAVVLLGERRRADDAHRRQGRGGRRRRTRTS